LKLKTDYLIEKLKLIRKTRIDMYYSFNNEKKPVKTKNLPDNILGAYIKPQLVGRKIVANFENPKNRRVNKSEINFQPENSPFKIISRVSLNNSLTEEENKLIETNKIFLSPQYKSLQFKSIDLPVLPAISTVSKRADTIERDYIRTEETLISRYKLQNLGLKNTYKNVMKHSLDGLSMLRYSRHEALPSMNLKIKSFI
jgi:hypothetical protein